MDRASQEARRAEVERRVLTATTALLAEGHSFADLSISAIAARASLSRSAFYDYFADKRALVLRLTEDVTERLLAEAATWRREDLDLVDALPTLLTSVARLYTEHPDVLRAITEAANYDEVMSKWWHEHLNVITNTVQAVLELEQAQGRATEQRTDLTACVIVWMVQQTCFQELVLNNRFTPDEVVASLTQLITQTLVLTGREAVVARAVR